MPRPATQRAPVSVVEMSWPEWVDSGAWQDSADGIPMLPALAHEIAEVALNPDVPAIKISGIVSKDPVLATSVIQLANSAFSAPAGQITSINEAVVRMGTSAVRSIVTASCLTSMMANPKIYGARGRDMVDHSIGTAYLARLVADACGGESDEAFLAGLLHDIGKLLILKLAAETHRGVARPLPVELDTTLAERHAAFGGFLVTKWRLPSCCRIRLSGTTNRRRPRSGRWRPPLSTWRIAWRIATDSAARGRSSTSPRIRCSRASTSTPRHWRDSTSTCPACSPSPGRSPPEEAPAWFSLEGEPDLDRHLPVGDPTLFDRPRVSVTWNHRRLRIVVPARAMALRTASSALVGDEPTSSTVL